MTEPILFALGQVVATPQALALAEKHQLDLLHHLHRHQIGDWNNLSTEDIQANHDALIHGARIMSCFDFGNDQFWIITEADRTLTTILLPNNY